MLSFTEWMNRQQILLYLVSIAAGSALGIALPSLSDQLGFLITPFLGLLLYITFLSMPLTKALQGLKDLRFIFALMVTNFIAVPALVFALSRFVVADQAVLIGVALVLLAPCVDYVIVFSGLAGGANQKLLAATPLLLVVQMMLIPVYMYFIAGKSPMEIFSPEPFIEALILLILIPLALAWSTQVFAKKHSVIRYVSHSAELCMVPAMMGTLFCVVGSQIHSVSTHFEALAGAAIIFGAFVPLAAFFAYIIGRSYRLPAPALRALAFSGVTRNSLVVLPIALALPPEFSLASSVVVTQTLAELVAMLVMIKAIPILIKSTST